jgi:dTDP-4-amino-4,6-dideoxygalactose transaminase
VNVDDPIPSVDLASQHSEIAGEVDEGFRSVLERTAFVGGAEVAEFERELAAFCGVALAVGVANGTDAIELALRAAGIGPGDEVIVPANTFIATAEAVVRAGASVVLADCAPDTLLVDPVQVARRVTDATRAVVGVDLYGQIAPVEALAVAGSGVAVIEDAAQSQGARRHGLGIGAHPSVLATPTSFYPGKNLGAYGDGGAVLTSDHALAEQVRAIGNHGGLARYEHKVIGVNSRLDTLQAVVLRAKLRRLAAWNEARREAARRYDALLGDIPGVRLPVTAEGNEHVWHLYVVRLPERDRVIAALQARGIGAGIHYPLPVHLTAAFAHLGHGRGDFPVAEEAAGTILSLPMHPHLTAAQQERVATTLADAVAEVAA